MFFLVHTAIGLLILKLFPNNPILVLILAFLSHWVADFIPHFDVPKISKGKKIFWGGMDAIFSIIFIISFVIFTSSSLYLAIGVALLSFLPDLFYIIEIFSGKKFLKRIFFDFHIKMQNEFSWGWIVELVILISISCLLFLRII
jgi:hypothetical protein